MEELHEMLRDRQVLDVYRNARLSLAMMQPNGATVHKKANVEIGINGVIFRYENRMHPHEETFEQFRERDPERYERKLGLLKTAIEYFRITV